jgi:hypothetical protein
MYVWTIEILVLKRVCLHWSSKQFWWKKPCKKSADLQPRQGNLLQRNIFTGLSLQHKICRKKIRPFFQHASSSTKISMFWTGYQKKAGNFFSGLTSFAGFTCFACSKQSSNFSDSIFKLFHQVTLISATSVSDKQTPRDDNDRKIHKSKITKRHIKKCKCKKGV